MSVPIRWMVKSDQNEVHDIERRCFREEAWSTADWNELHRQKNVICMVAEACDGRVVAYMAYELRQRSLVLLSLAVHPEEQGIGVGRALIEKLISKLGKNRPTLRVWVSSRNTPAQQFFARMGLVAIGVDNERFVSVRGNPVEAIEFVFSLLPSTYSQEKR